MEMYWIRVDTKMMLLGNKDIKNHVENETEKVLTCVLTMIGISIFELEGSKVSSVV